MPAKIIIGRSQKHYVTDPSKDFHTKDGFIHATDLEKGGLVLTNKKKEFHVLPAGFSDHIEKLKRHAQIISKKDIGTILVETGADSTWTIVDAGAGSGMLSCHLARQAKHIVTYDVDDRSIETTKKNVELFGLKNIEVKKGDVYLNIAEKNVDLVTLDLPSPWNALANASSALKSGGWLVVYNPHITQNQKVVIESEKHTLVHIKTIEMIERSWSISEKQCRPNFDSLGHTGFLSFFRKL